MERKVIFDPELLEDYDLIIDVRTPSEYENSHLPNAVNFPVLSDKERVLVGTVTREKGEFEARKIGAPLILNNISDIISNQLFGYDKNFKALVYCWRGGARSKSLVTFLREIGWSASQLDGGYRAFRRHLVEESKRFPKGMNWIALDGLTGTGKTKTLQYLAKLGYHTLDLEGIACHKGSVLGADLTQGQPSQKAFEIELWECLRKIEADSVVFVEAESRKVGNLHIPEELWEEICKAKCLKLEVDIDERVRYLISDYQYFLKDPIYLTERVSKLKKLRGSEKIDMWLEQIQNQSWQEFVKSILETHYDKSYLKHYADKKADWIISMDKINDFSVIDKWLMYQGIKLSNA